jgi:signal transduction histidine kinase/ligand-binding sensor domain-containing protein
MCVGRIFSNVYCWWLLPFLLVGSGSVTARQYHQVAHYDVNDGLSQNSVWQTIQDNNGFIWILTSSGLNRFDGSNFRVFRSNPQYDHSIRSNHIINILNGSNGDIWIGNTGGVDKYNATLNRIDRFFSIDSFGDVSYSLIGLEQGLLWIWIFGHGAYGIEIKTGKLVRHFDFSSLHPSPQNDECLSSIIIDRDKFVFSFSGSGLFIHDLATGQSKKLSTVPHRRNTNFLLGISDSLVVYNATGGVVGLSILNLHSQQLSVLPTGGCEVTDACTVGGNLYCTASDYRLRTLSLQAIAKQGNKELAILPDSINVVAVSLFADRSGVMWIGTDGAGLYKLAPPYRQFRNYKTKGSATKLVKSIFTSDSLLYSCLYNGYIDVFNNDGRFVEQLTGGDGASFKNIVASTKEHGTSYWLAGEHCFGVYDVKSRRFTSYLQQLQDVGKSIKFESHFCALHKRSNEELLVGAGTSLLRLQKRNSERYIVELVKEFDQNRITCIASNRSKVLVGNVFEVYEFDTLIGNGRQIFTTKSDLVKCLLLQGDSLLWIGTENGLFQYFFESGKARRYDEKDGLPNATIYGLIRAGNHIWISTNRGLSRYDIAKGTFKNYGVADGLQSNEFNTGAFYYSEQNQLYFGGISGINGFHDTDIRDNPCRPQVKITSIKLFEMPLVSDTAYEQLSMLAMPYRENTLSFEFVALDFSDPDLNRYAYMMAGIDKTWIQSGNRRFARYANMQPGQYKFLVKACNSHGVWSDKPTVVNITISAPFWKTKLFLAGVFLLSIGLIVLGVTLFQKRRFRKLLLKAELQNKLQLERERISRDLHDNVGAQISYLVSNLEWITDHELGEQDKTERLKDIGETARNMMGNMRETIWALNKKTISTSDLSDKIKTFAKQYLRHAAQLVFVADEQIESDVSLAPAEALNIYRICQEAIVNVLKHADASIIEFQIIVDRRGVMTLKVIDNGKGFENEEIDPSLHFGLENMKHRALASGLQFELEPVSGKGTTITLTRSGVIN